MFEKQTKELVVITPPTAQKMPYWTEHVIDNDSGAGLNIVVQDMNKDRKADIVIANKNGVFLFENQMK